MKKKFLRTSTVLIVVMCWVCNHASYGDHSVSEEQEGHPSGVLITFLDEEEMEEEDRNNTTPLDEEEIAHIHTGMLLLNRDLSDTDDVSHGRCLNYFAVFCGVMILVVCIALLTSAQM